MTADLTPWPPPCGAARKTCLEIPMSGHADRHAFVKPPRATRQPKVDTWHGVELVDDYAWLKASNWRVRLAACFADFWISRTSRRC